MLTFIQKRLGSERGFTLIELLVVMIIISILMAVAVPVFLSQKQKALASNAKQNAKHIQDTIESCAAGTSTGSLTDSASGFSCGTVPTLKAEEPSLTKLLEGNNCGGERICVEVRDVTADNYVIWSSTNTTGQQGAVYFRVTRNQESVTRDCDPVAGAGAVKAMQRMCPTDSW